jgi:hypothetical protein
MEEAIKRGLKKHWNFFPTIKELTEQCEEVASENWKAREEARLKALPPPEKTEISAEDMAVNLKLLKDLKESHFKVKHRKFVEKAPTMTDREVLDGLDRLAEEWDANA